MTRLRKIIASVESVTNAIKSAGLGNPVVAYLDNQGEGFYISYLKLNRPKSAKNVYDRTLFLIQSNNIGNPLAKEVIKDDTNAKSEFERIEQIAIDKIASGKGNPKIFERKVLKQYEDLQVPAENQKWEEVIDKYSSAEADRTNADLAKDAYAITAFLLEKKEGGAVELLIGYDPNSQYMCLIRDDSVVVNKELIQKPKEAQAIYDKMIKQIISAGRNLAKDNNLQSLQSKDYYKPSKFKLPLQTGSSDWVNFCAEFGNQEKEKARKEYQKKSKNPEETKNIDPKQFNLNNYISTYTIAGCHTTGIYFIKEQNAMVLYDRDASAIIDIELLDDGEDYAAPFNKLEKEALDLVRKNKTEGGRNSRSFNHQPPIPIDVSNSPEWSKFLEEQRKKNEKQDKKEDKIDNEQGNGQQNTNKSTLNDDSVDKKKVRNTQIDRKTTYKNQKTQKETTTIELLFNNEEIDTIRAMIKDMINKKFDFNYSITDGGTKEVEAKFNSIKVMALIDKYWCFKRLRKVAEFSVGDANDYLQVDLNIKPAERPLAIYCTTKEPNQSNCLGMIVKIQGKFLAMGSSLDDDSFAAIADEMKQKKTLEESINNLGIDSLKLAGSFDDAEAWILQRNPNNILSKQADDNLRKTPHWNEYTKDWEENQDENEKKDDKDENQDDKDDNKPKTKKIHVKRLRMHYIPTKPINDYLDQWLKINKDVVLNALPTLEQPQEINVEQEPKQEEKKSASKINRIKERIKNG